MGFLILATNVFAEKPVIEWAAERANVIFIAKLSADSDEPRYTIKEVIHGSLEEDYLERIVDGETARFELEEDSPIRLTDKDPRNRPYYVLAMAKDQPGRKVFSFSFASRDGRFLYRLLEDGKHQYLSYWAMTAKLLEIVHRSSGKDAAEPFAAGNG